MKAEKGREENVVTVVPLKCDVIFSLGKSRVYGSAQLSREIVKQLTAKKGATSCLSVEIVLVALKLSV